MLARDANRPHRVSEGKGFVSAHRGLSARSNGLYAPCHSLRDYAVVVVDHPAFGQDQAIGVGELRGLSALDPRHEFHPLVNVASEAVQGSLVAKHLAVRPNAVVVAHAAVRDYHSEVIICEHGRHRSDTRRVAEHLGGH